MLTTQYAPGAPVWIDLGTPDVEGASAFYRRVFGWEFAPAGPDGGGYGLLRRAGRTVAALGPLTEEGARSAWIIYFKAPDAEWAAKTVEQAGGTVRSAPFDAGGAATVAQASDPAGAEFALWQPGGSPGLDMVTEEGSLSWTELRVPDPAGAALFYRALFGWRVAEMELGDRTYEVMFTTDGDESGFGDLVRGERPHWLPYFEVTDCDAAVAAAQEMGGVLTEPAETVRGAGRFATMTDPFGASFAVITSPA
jgi:uncharacterized protein